MGLTKRFVLPVLVYHMVTVGISIEQIAIMAAIGYIAKLLFELPSGGLADKIGYKPTLLIAGIMQTVGMLMYLGNTFEWFLIATVLYWVGGAFKSGADTSLFYERLLYLKKEKLHKKYLGNAVSISAAITILAALLAGVTYQIWWALPFIITAVTIAIASGLILSFGGTNHQPNKSISVITNIKTALKYIHGNGILKYLIVFNALVTGLMLGVNEFNGVFLENAGIAAATVGVIYALRHVFRMITGPFAHKIAGRLKPTLFLAITAILISVLFAILGYSTSPLSIGLVIALVAIPQTLLQVGYADYIQQLSISKVRSSISSAGEFIMSIIMIVTILAIGFISKTLDISAIVVYISAIILVLSAPVLILLSKSKSIIDLK